MRHLAKVSLSSVVSLCLAGSLFAAEKREYLTEDEIDLIRDAQELSLRVPIYFKLAERRLIFLGVMEKSEKEKEKERKDKEKREKEKKKNPFDTRATANKAPLEDTSYLADFTSAELLRGYIQVLDEAMTNIDDAYSRKLDVRDSIEDLEKFARDTIPLLEKFKPKNDSERSALEDAVQKAKQTQADAKEALNIVPKTEKKRKQ